MTRRTTIAVLLCGLAAMAAGSEPPSGVAGEVWAADVEFDRSVAEGDVELFASLLADTAVFMGGGLLKGKEAVLEGWAPLFAQDRATVLRWTPHTVDVAESGDLAYTLGDFEITSTLPDGTEARLAGTYVSIWKKGEDGKWRVVVDAGTPPE